MIKEKDITEFNSEIHKNNLEIEKSSSFASGHTCGPKRSFERVEIG